jgi:hypothetical protein
VGLAFLRDLRGTLADMYAVMVKLPAEGISPSSGRWQPEPAEDPAFVRLLERLPADLYWSALRPLTWETVGDRGARDLAGPLIFVVRTSRDLWETAKADLEKSMNVLPLAAAFQFKELGPANPRGIDDSSRGSHGPGRVQEIGRSRRDVLPQTSN